MTRHGYYRVPSAGPADAPAHVLLALEGCATINHDRCSANGVVRPGLDAALKALKPGDVLVVPNLHALAGSLVDLLDVMGRLYERPAYLVSVREDLDTQAVQPLDGFCTILRRFNDQRIAVRKGEGLLTNPVGAPTKIRKKDWAEVLPRLKAVGKDRMTLDQAAQALGVSRSTVARKLKVAEG